MVATPTLIRDYPPPQRRIVGDHSDVEALRVALELYEESVARTGSD
ncbi:MAG: hypothetical protein EXQ94_13500 [Alphaproteobacteria bacterium]|nr:hypothetical protein [Alphaproteobacteria bacterium]